MAAGDLVQTIFEQRCAHSARSAETATLMGEEMRKIDDDCQEVASLTKHHERAAGGQILKAKFTIEFCLINQRAGRPSDLHRLNILRAAVIQHLLNADAEWIFINPRCRAVTTDTQNFAARRFFRAHCSEPCTAMQCNMSGGSKCFHIVDHGRLTELAMCHRNWRTVARHPALAFQRFDQRQFFAADVSPRPDYDLDVEIESRMTENVVAQQTQFATMRQHGLQLRQQVAILAAQIEKTLFCPDYRSAYGHSFEHRI